MGQKAHKLFRFSVVLVTSQSTQKYITRVSFFFLIIYSEDEFSASQ